MAIVDERWPGASVRANPPATFDRQPPQDIAAEQCVLGGMLLSKDAIADVVEIARVSTTSTGPRTPWSSTRSSTCTAAASRPTPITVAAELDRSR